MLQFLRIRNLALLDSIELEFDAGFTAVTGETGAGKSILLGALALLSGARADKSVIRQGADACEVEAGLHFADTAAIDRLLTSLSLPPCDDGQLLLKRVIPRERAPRISVNGSLATLANLQAIGETWIDFHGPGEPRRLLRSECQIELLDLFGQLAAEAATYRETHREWQAALAGIERLSGETRLDPDQIDFLTRQIAAIESLDLEPESVETLERDFNRLSRAQELAALGATLAGGLSGDDGLLGRLAPLVRAGRQLAQIDPTCRPLSTRLDSLAVETEDLGVEFERFAGELAFDAREAADLEAKMATLLDLRRKHGPTTSAILAARDHLRRRLAEQGDIEGALERLRVQATALEARCRELAASLRQAREKAGKTLTRRATTILGELGFAKASLQLDFVPEPGLRPHGDARPELLFAPNVGEPPMPLARIASSGELARVMLALKAVLAEVDDIPVLVFDEVDANVGGEIGRVVGEKMAGIAERHQVLCVTHLPQVAALGTRHLVVEKDQRGERAVVTIRPIHETRKARISELARMLGDRASASALAHAEQLLAPGRPVRTRR